MRTMVVCKQCGCEFDPNGEPGRRKFCGGQCYTAWRRHNKSLLKGTFKPGATPWNAGTKGVMKPNATSFKKGMQSHKLLPCGSVTIRVDKSGKPRAFVKCLDAHGRPQWKLRAVAVWEQHNGPAGCGMVIHHIDRDTLNDDIANLAKMTRAEHIREHRAEHEEKRRSALVRRRA